MKIFYIKVQKKHVVKFSFSKLIWKENVFFIIVGMIREENISSYETKSNEKREIYCLVENITGT